MTGNSDVRQMRPGLWATINQRYPGSMVDNDDYVPLAKLGKPPGEARFCLVSTSGVQPKNTLPFDTVHPVGDCSFRKFRSDIDVRDLEIHQLKYPTSGAKKDINVIFPIERMRELALAGLIGGMTDHVFTFIGYNMDPKGFQIKLAKRLADAVADEKPDAVIASPA